MVVVTIWIKLKCETESVADVRTFGVAFDWHSLLEDMCVHQDVDADFRPAHAANVQEILLAHRAVHVLRTEQTVVGTLRLAHSLQLRIDVGEVVRQHSHRFHLKETRYQFAIDESNGHESITSSLLLSSNQSMSLTPAVTYAGKCRMWPKSWWENRLLLGLKKCTNRRRNLENLMSTLILVLV